jgi:hypothetical protein
VSENGRWLGHVSGAVALDPAISVTAKAVYLVLAVHADRHGFAFPSVTRIAVGIGRARSTVNLALNELVDAGVLRIERRWHEGRQTSNGYHLLDISAARPGDDQ